MSRSHYVLMCLGCENRYVDDGLMLRCQEPHADALLTSVYQGGVDHEGAGLYRFSSLLPVARSHPEAASAVVVPAEELGAQLGLTRLWMAFSGYWPEIGANLTSCTFKELEAYTVLGRLPESPPTVVVASAGNTAAAFAQACGANGVPCVIIVPDSAFDRMRFVDALNPCVRLITLVGGTYADATALAAALAELPGHQAEGGFRNVARRDGLGTVLLAAHEAMGELPDYYFQAVGSGAGAIGVYEAAVRLEGEGAGRPPRVVMCQNLPFAPIHTAWTNSPRTARGAMFAPELANSKPPYTTIGGVRDCLVASGGDVLAVGNADAYRAKLDFARTYGIDIEPGAAVALACLRQAVECGVVRRNARILLNITGGGRARFAREHALLPAEAAARITVTRAREFPSTEDVVRVLAKLDRGGDLVCAQ